MNLKSKILRCNCPNSCDYVSYAFYASAKKLQDDEDLLCPNRKAMSSNDLMYSFYQDNALPKKFLAWFNYLVNNEDFKEDDLYWIKL